MYNPVSTYRIQFHKDFNFKSFDRIIPYLVELGIDTIYASPIFEAIPGSMHGYDVVNPHRINPEIGTEAELMSISKKLKASGIKWLQDIVPNHMAFHPANSWLMDVLKNGEQSEYASFFDIDFNVDGKLMVPFLGKDLKEIIEEGELKIVNKDNQYYINCSGSDWPLSAVTTQKLNPARLDEINNDVAALKTITEAQHYRLCNWQETDHKMNYRRFFTVNSLICLNIQDEQAFNKYHEYILKLVRFGVFQGLRIDHIDGLYDPKQYLDRLRKRVGEEIYIVVEKILEQDEQMPQDWNTQGSTGYDFLAIMNNLLSNKSAEKSFDNLYENVTGKQLDPEVLIDEKKRTILFEHMHGELNNLVKLFEKLNLISPAEIVNPESDDLMYAIAELMINMPVYRYYQFNFPLSGKDLTEIEDLIQPLMNNTKLKHMGKLFWQVFIDNPTTHGKEYCIRVQQFYQRLMQFTGPLMAKGVEDTAMFTYNRFIGHSEVGDAPDAFGISTETFHSKMVERQNRWPLALNGSSTHDTKRGEDVRARLNVLTDLPEAWEETVSALLSHTEKIKSEKEIYQSLHNNDVYLIYQTIVGALPMPGEDEDDFQNRLSDYIEKALREAKKRSGWAAPNEEYESIVKDFANELLNKNGKSYAVIAEFSKKIADFGIINSLAQVLLKFTCPGIPDLYQGTELWDLSLVDPDNRRPVDYQKRKEFLSGLEGKSIDSMWGERYSGKIKLWLTNKLLQIRKEYESIFTNGAYIPLKVKGKYAAHICAYLRKFEGQYLLVALPLGFAALAAKEEITGFDWLDTQIVLPEQVPGIFSDLLSDNEGSRDILNKGILVNQIFTKLPLGLLKLKTSPEKRSAGILMHITSLPSAYGIGDLGKEAYKFIDCLKHARQQYWQILPINPTKEGNGHSPYSSNSAMAGNILLICPEELVSEGLLSEKEVKQAILPKLTQVDFNAVEKTKRKLLSSAYKNFITNKNKKLKDAYQTFCENEKSWLNDYAVYVAMKHDQEQKEWCLWPDEYKRKDEKAINAFVSTHEAEIDEIKWQQFIFYRQWHQLKNYSNSNGVQIIGDLPFYVDYDSVEVWSHPNLFKLDKDLNPEQLAGVPPDYFNEKGQLWGMPVFNSDEMKASGYRWWIDRLKKNMELFDLLRLDHFRAFSSSWEVPAGSTDAINGKWEKGMGNGFLKAIQDELGELPFIAEDLGEITDDVEQLRNDFKLPGMKVLQFAFGEDLATSVHIPYNYNSTNCIAYSGTHDNNTTQGWFANEIDKATKKRIRAYAGKSVKEKNIHQEILKLVYSSIAKTAIIPIQDVLGLGEEARMNIPGSSSDNWGWRLKPDDLHKKTIKWLKKQCIIYGRNN